MLVEECIAAFAIVYRAADVYPEDVPFLTEWGGSTKGDVVLATSFVQSYVSIYADLLLEGAPHVEAALAELEQMHD